MKYTNKQEAIDHLNNLANGTTNIWFHGEDVEKNELLTEQEKEEIRAKEKEYLTQGVLQHTHAMSYHNLPLPEDIVQIMNNQKGKWGYFHIIRKEGEYIPIRYRFLEAKTNGYLVLETVNGEIVEEHYWICSYLPKADPLGPCGFMFVNNSRPQYKRWSRSIGKEIFIDWDDLGWEEHDEN